MIAYRIFIGLAALTAIAHGQTFDEYLKLRKKHGITQHTTVAALETLVGSRVLEVKGVVKGTFKIDKSVLLVEATDGGHVHIYYDNAPQWLTGNSISARLLVKAERKAENEELTATLIGAAAEPMMARYEAENPPKPPPASSKPSTIPALKGPIGRGKSTKNWSLPASDATPHYAAFIKSRNPRLSDSEAWRIAEGVIGFSIQYGVDARLVMAMVLVESGFNPKATSRAGAMGLGQLMPGTARGMGVNNAYDSIENLNGTVRLIRGHLDKYQAKVGDEYEALVLALAAYNAGSGAVRRHGGVPPYKETQNYIRKVISVYRSLSGQ